MRDRPRRRGVLKACGAAAIVIITTSVSLFLAKDLGPYPSPQRATADLICTKVEPAEVCLFPEQRWNPTANAITVVSDALKNLKKAGIEIPTRVSATLMDGRPGTIDLVYRRDFDATTIVHSLSTSITPQAQEGASCPRDDPDPTPRLLVMYVTQSALYRLASNTQDAQAQTNPEVDQAATRLFSLAPAVRARWINEAIHALGDCGLPLPQMPGTGN